MENEARAGRECNSRKLASHDTNMHQGRNTHRPTNWVSKSSRVQVGKPGGLSVLVGDSEDEFAEVNEDSSDKEEEECGGDGEYRGGEGRAHHLKLYIAGAYNGCHHTSSPWENCGAM